MPGIHCVAAPVLDHHGRAAGAITIARPANRIPEAEFPAIGSVILRGGTTGRRAIQPMKPIQYRMREGQPPGAALLAVLAADDPGIAEYVASVLSGTPASIDAALEALQAERQRSDLVLVDVRNGVRVHPRDVGVGVSQVLPVIVAALYRVEHGAGAFVVVEQPELHVHPKLQVSLADLFIQQACAGTVSDHQFLLETHSEHILLRLLRRIREGQVASQAEDEQTSRKGVGGSVALASAGSDDRTVMVSAGAGHEEITVRPDTGFSRLPRRVALGVPLGRPEFPANLKGDIRLARAGGHRQQHALPALQNGLHGAVNRDALIIARLSARAEIGRREQTVGNGVVLYFLAHT